MSTRSSLAYADGFFHVFTDHEDADGYVHIELGPYGVLGVETSYFTTEHLGGEACQRTEIVLDAETWKKLVTEIRKRVPE